MVDLEQDSRGYPWHDREQFDLYGVGCKSEAVRATHVGHVVLHQAIPRTAARQRHPVEAISGNDTLATHYGHEGAHGYLQESSALYEVTPGGEFADHYTHFSGSVNDHFPSHYESRTTVALSMIFRAAQKRCRLRLSHFDDDLALQAVSLTLADAFAILKEINDPQV